jgi:hypothetical protein
VTNGSYKEVETNTLNKSHNEIATYSSNENNNPIIISIEDFTYYTGGQGYLPNTVALKCFIEITNDKLSKLITKGAWKIEMFIDKNGTKSDSALFTDTFFMFDNDATVPNFDNNISVSISANDNDDIRYVSGEAFYKNATISINSASMSNTTN